MVIIMCSNSPCRKARSQDARSKLADFRRDTDWTDWNCPTDLKASPSVMEREHAGQRDKEYTPGTRKEDRIQIEVTWRGSVVSYSNKSILTDLPVSTLVQDTFEKRETSLLLG